jgi:hypothetical protein
MGDQFIGSKIKKKRVECRNRNRLSAGPTAMFAEPVIDVLLHHAIRLCVLMPKDSRL